MLIPALHSSVWVVGAQGSFPVSGAAFVPRFSKPIPHTLKIRPCSLLMCLQVERGVASLIQSVACLIVGQSHGLT